LKEIPRVYQKARGIFYEQRLISGEVFDCFRNPSTACGAKSAAASFGCIEGIELNLDCLDHGRDDELGDTLSAFSAKRLVAQPG
jgi:hypothetical protein